MAKKKAVGTNEALDEAQGNEITEQAEAISAVMPKAPESGKPKKKKKKRPVRCIRQHTDLEFRREFREVCETLIKKAKSGSIPETRLLLQIGKFGDPKVAKRRGARSLSEMLLDELKRRQDEREAVTDGTRAEERVTQAKRASSEGATSGGDAEHETEHG